MARRGQWRSAGAATPGRHGTIALALLGLPLLLLPPGWCPAFVPLSSPSGARQPKLPRQALQDPTTSEEVKDPAERAELFAKLSADMADLAQKKLASARDLEIRFQLLEEIREVYANATGTKGVEVLPFGSIANGCGERSSDVDATILTPALRKWFRATRRHEVMSGNEVNEEYRKVVVRVLDRLEKLCEDKGFTVQQYVRETRVPVLTVSKRRIQFDLTGSMVPVHNSRLLKSYAELCERLPAMVLVVKRWAKQWYVAGAPRGWFSSYSYTMMVVYFLQVHGYLPSLQAIAEEEGLEPLSFQDVKGKPLSFAFASAEEAEGRWQRPAELPSLGELLVDFFHFYAHEFKWGDEVVSVRLGRRSFISKEAVLFPKPFYKMQLPGGERLHLEDPLECHRNLNFALTPERHLSLRKTMSIAAEKLRAGCSLDEFLSKHAPQRGARRGGRQRVVRRHWPPPPSS